VKDTFFPKKKVLNVRGNIWTLDRPVVMGILNLTPDSFYDGGKHDTVYYALRKATELYELGAKIVDLGAFSSRPGAAMISEEQEWARLEQVLKAIKKEHPYQFISVDTFRAEIARRSLDLGADIINDISGGQLDVGMMCVCAAQHAPYIAMHMKGTPATMQEETDYKDLVLDLVDYFIGIEQQAKEAGLTDWIVDPGFGFAKTLAQNYFLLDHLASLKVLNRPLLVGVSRKSMIYKTLLTEPAQALNGTTALHTTALMRGADILRAHDVKEALESITLYHKLSN
jgi:dihydropteroate synthase